MRLAGDDSLSVWHKRSQPVLQYPPENLPLVGWRDPYIFEVGGNGKEWGMLLGSGLKGKGGAVLIYRSASLHEGVDLLAACLPHGQLQTPINGDILRMYPLRLPGERLLES